MENDKKSWFVLLAWLGFWFGFIALVQLARAQPRRHPTDAELLVRTTVHESGWDDTGDMEAIYAVLAAGAEREGISFRSFARRYSRHLHTGDVTRRWASELVEACTAPPSWPEVTTVRRRGEVRVVAHAPWRAYVERCRSVFGRAHRVISGELTHRCERAPHDWGGRVDRARARRLGLLPVDCGPTIGDYYARPSLVRAEGEPPDGGGE